MEEGERDKVSKMTTKFNKYTCLLSLETQTCLSDSYVVY